MLNLCLSTTVLTQEQNEEIASNLILPKPKILEIDNTKLLTFTAKDYNIILQLYATYQLYTENRTEYNEILYSYGNELKLCTERLELNSNALTVLIDDREFIYKNIDKSMKNLNKQTQRNKIKIAFFTAGGIITGIGAGILIGMLVK